MNTDDRMSGRWIGLLLAGALVLGACGSTTSESEAADDDIVSAEPAALALAEEVTAEQTTADEAPANLTSADEFDVDDFTSLEDLENVELTPELITEIRTNEAARPIVVAEMEAQGLTADQASCLLDNVSPGLFIVFGMGAQPDEEQFVELIELLGTCEITGMTG